ncbi:accessory gene regulator ArgB-like protein [Clostridium botulinum]|uniref:accessory gene regulator ArgB-like protein n=1 Tax=Clostridium botulinum TaxID=1491 RepID=UPI0002FB6458|nr:accessory gene regulator B family protein [Clostridium botulinum]KLU74752.1 accessory gene regulator AgrB [Clostridium botulinum V891]MCD3253854.1 accessory gene regulator B family protein [Clostridium botulinum C/D]MCD3279400.1 accessory gene regulator B family protein [Clostridium botulinum C/D]MCD3283414.1 accessory gene regulator B family protein [Clostridium botulinum C/D]MCD3339056.1 accessory gene regulator B family protein [Clostridium botulinum C/D]
MLNKITLQITNYIRENSNIKNEDDLDRINYSLQAILGDLIKFIVLTIIFWGLGRLKYFLFSASILISLRIFMGGYHCRTFMRCLFTSLIIFLITSFIGPKIPILNQYTYYGLSIFSILITVIYAPFPNIKRPIKNKKRRQILKLISIFSLIVWISLLLFKLNTSSYLNCGFLTLLLQAIQIFIIPLKGGLFYEKTK